MVSIVRFVPAAALLVLAGISLPSDLPAQTQLVSSNYFPAELEFKELQKIRSTKSAKDSAAIADVKEAPLFAEAGFLNYERRIYLTETGTDLAIEVLTARDQKAAYSLLTLLRNGDLAAGPPGDSFWAGNSSLIFAKGAFWTRIHGAGSPDLLRRIALSVSNRIGAREHSIPALVSRFPQGGLDSNTIRYFLGPISLESYGTEILEIRPALGPEMELAQARYHRNGQAGILSLISFPTGQAAESYFDGLSRPGGSAARKVPGRSYGKRVGPIVGVLEGDFDPAEADAILRELKFSYSIRWIYDKNNRDSRTVWGVPVGILGTVVRSLLLTALLCGLSIFFGVGMAAFRLFLRSYAPNNPLDRPERTEIIRLRLNEGPSKSDSSSLEAGTKPNS